MWADWIGSVLERAGFRVVPRDVSVETVPTDSLAGQESTARTVLVLSSAYLKSARTMEVWERSVAEDPTGASRGSVEKG